MSMSKFYAKEKCKSNAYFLRPTTKLAVEYGGE